MLKPLLLILSVLSLAGCLPSTIDTTCEEIATKQCNMCYSTCTVGTDTNVDGAALCQLPEETNAETCVKQFTERCRAAASVRERANAELNQCLDALEPDTGQGLTCTQLYKRYALDGEHPTEECQLFL